MVIATQNSVDPREIGTATSANSFFRTLGGAFGTALLGTILDSRLQYWLQRLLPAQVSRKLSTHVTSIVNSPALVEKLPVAARTQVRDAFIRSLHTEFLVTVPFAVVALLFSLGLKEVDLRTTTGLHASKLADIDDQADSVRPDVAEIALHP